jgi:hypothetical protein
MGPPLLPDPQPQLSAASAPPGCAGRHSAGVPSSTPVRTWSADWAFRESCAEPHDHQSCELGRLWGAGQIQGVMALSPRPGRWPDGAQLGGGDVDAAEPFGRSRCVLRFGAGGQEAAGLPAHLASHVVDVVACFTRPTGGNDLPPCIAARVASVAGEPYPEGAIRVVGMVKQPVGPAAVVPPSAGRAPAGGPAGWCSEESWPAGW